MTVKAPQGRRRWSPTTSIIRHGATAEALARLRPAFDKDGTVTAGNASRHQRRRRGAGGDVAPTRPRKRGLTPLARIASFATAGRRSGDHGHGPDPGLAARRWPRPAGSVDDLDLIEANEAFAAQACAVNKDLGWDTGKMNVNGGAIAIGHPDRRLGRADPGRRCCTRWSGADAKKGLATLCIGGGMGVALTRRALIRERPNMSAIDIVIASAKRTAVGSFNGAFANTPPTNSARSRSRRRSKRRGSSRPTSMR